MENYGEIKKLIIDSLKNMESQYYHLERAPSKKELKESEKVRCVIRERNFCYELYHQIRCANKTKQVLDNNLQISAEIDKRGYKLIENNKIPDFIIHEPGTMDNNCLVIEVKGVIDKAGIAKDFNTLLLFLDSCKYKKGIFILFNHSLTELKKHMNDIISKREFTTIQNKDCFKNIEIICMKEPQSNPEVIVLDDLLKCK